MMNRFIILSRISTCNLLLKSSFHQSLVSFLDQKWRKDKGLAENSNSFGPLTNFPDYAYMDGRKTPLGQRQKTRVLRQREIAQKIVDMSKEIDFAIKRDNNIKLQHEDAHKNILESKLRPKGHLLLQKGNK